MLLRDPRAMGKGPAERDMPSSGSWAGPSTSGSEAGPAPGLAAGSALRAGHGALHLPLAAEKEAEKVWFSLIFFFKSFLAPLPFIVFCQYFFEGAGERGAGNVWQVFVFNSHKLIFFVCACVSSLSGNSLQTGTSCRNCHFQGKNTLQRHFVPFSFPRAPCAWPRNAPTVPCHSLPLQCSTNWGHSGAALSLVGGHGAGFGQEQARGWVSPALVGQGCADSPALAEGRPRCVASCSPLALSLAAADAACPGTTCLHTALQNGQAAPGRAIWGHLLLAGPASAHPLPPVSPCSVPSSTGQTLSHPDRHMKFAGPAVRAGRQGGSQECEVK